MKSQIAQIWGADSPESMADFFNARAAQYDEVHTGHIDGGKASKDIIAGLLPETTQHILDLGCGTGMELPAVYARFPDAAVTGIDLAENMLALCRARCAGHDFTGICGSYLEHDFGLCRYDAVISVMSLHHFTPTQKEELFRRVKASLAPGGVFLNCDYYAKTGLQEWQGRRSTKIVRSKITEGIAHVDIPLTVRHELQLLRKAGFASAKEVWGVGNTRVVAGEG